MNKHLNIAIALLIVAFSLAGLAEAVSMTSDTISFYIPLSGSDGTYGESGYGMSPDQIVLNGSVIDGPLMEMFLYFSIPDGEVGNKLTLTFSDLDLAPYNDPTGFFERLYLYGQGGLPNGYFEDYNVLDSRPNVDYYNYNPTTNNKIAVTFEGLTIQPGGGNFWLHMGFEAYSTFDSGTWINTCESLVATIDTTPVPEPSAWLFLSLGLVGMIGAGIKKKFI